MFSFLIVICQGIYYKALPHAISFTINLIVYGILKICIHYGEKEYRVVHVPFV